MKRPFPNPLVTERLIIRAPTAADAEAMNEAVVETWEMLARWMPWAVELPTVEDSREVCTRMQSNTEKLSDFPLYAFDRSSGRLLLATGCHVRDWDVPVFEIGYWCRKSAQGNGYVTEAVRVITDTAFEVMGARRVEIKLDHTNLASKAVAERCGFRFEAEIVNCRRSRGGELRNTLIYALTRND